jgi:DNA-binding response OmpR family regulator
MHLVLVDDEPAILDILAAACHADGHVVTTFSSSLDALAFLQGNTADLLITDIVMPPPDGFRLVSAARKLHPRLDAILVTGYTQRYSLEDVLACGASDLLFKPFRLQELRARVRLAEERRRVLMQHLRLLTHALEDPTDERLQREARELRAALGDLKLVKGT